MCTHVSIIKREKRKEKGARRFKAAHQQYRAVGRSENLRIPVLFGGHNLPPLVEIGLTDLPKSGFRHPRDDTPVQGNNNYWETCWQSEIVSHLKVNKRALYTLSPQGNKKTFVLFYKKNHCVHTMCRQCAGRWTNAEKPKNSSLGSCDTQWPILEIFVQKICKTNLNSRFKTRKNRKS